MVKYRLHLMYALECLHTQDHLQILNTNTPRAQRVPYKSVVQKSFKGKLQFNTFKCLQTIQNVTFSYKL